MSPRKKANESEQATELEGGTATTNAATAVSPRAGSFDILELNDLERGITPETADAFLNPKLSTLMPDPYVLKDMEKAAERIAEAVIKHQKIGIIGDYDVDGATSTSVLRLFLTYLGIETAVHIPEREEGYGPSTLAFQEFADFGADLVITVDCGTTAFSVLNDAAGKFEIIVLDHHEAEVLLPKVYAVVNPKRLDEDDGHPDLGYMAAVGVVFMTVVAVNRLLRQKGFYTDKLPEPDLKQWLDLVALGTVCDVVTLLGLNRAFVTQGLKIIASRRNLGLKTLADSANINEKPDAYHLGFVLGLLSRHGTAQNDGNLLVQIVHHILNEHGQIVLGVVHPVSFVPGEAGVDNPHEFADHVDDHSFVRMLEGVQPVNVTSVVVILQNVVHNAFNLLFDGAHTHPSLSENS